MDMSAAALPPRQPSIPDTARSHPDFAAYQAYRTFCNRQMIEASRWEDWLAQREFHLRCAQIEKHSRFREFQTWMCQTQAGARKGPGAFPDNFIAWLGGARW